MEDSLNGGFILHRNSESSLVVEVKSKKHLDPSLMELKESVLGKLDESFSLREDGVLRYQQRLCVPNMDDLINRRGSSWFPLFDAFGFTKMYHGLREVFWWDGLKKDIAELLHSVQIANK